MALITIVMGVSLASCSKDDGSEKEDREEVSKEKKLKSMVRSLNEKSNLDITYTFDYDLNGRLTEAKCINGSNNDITSTKTYRFTWGEGIITATVNEETYNPSKYNTETYILTIEDGLLKREEADNLSITYSYSSKRLANFSYVKPSYEFSHTYIWENDKLLTIVEDNLTSTFTNWTQCKVGYSPVQALRGYKGEIDALILAHPEIIGMRTKQLPTMEEWVDLKDAEFPYTYEFDSEGYVSKITERTEWDDLLTYKLSWE